MTQRFDFIECDTCRKKPGSPELCYGCYRNRTTIDEMDDVITGLRKIIKTLVFILIGIVLLSATVAILG